MTETLDANKTALTHRATATAAVWLDGMGCKPVESEVPVAGGWIADLASFWEPTRTEAKLYKLHKAIGFDTTEIASRDPFGYICRHYGYRFTIVIEVKTSRADFLKDLGRKYGMWGTKDRGKVHATEHPPAHLCVLACPSGVMKSDESLLHWGCLRLNDSCDRVVKFDGMWSLNPQHPKSVEDLIAAVAIRRDHATRYGALRRALKALRAQESGAA